MNGAMSEAEGCGYLSRTGRDLVLYRGREARWRDVDRLLKKRAVQRVGLVEERQHAQLAVGDEALQGHLSPWDEAFDEDLPRGAAGGDGDVRPLQDSD